MSEAGPITPAEVADYRHARRHCDLILKGGIVSGVVYPSAICELARSFSFRNLGGTSSGAIAAAAAAAAEHGRRAGRGAHFARLAQVPAELAASPAGGGPSLLFTLFQPAPATRPLFNLFIAGMGSRGRLPRLLGALAANFPFAALLGALPGLLLLIALAVGSSLPGLILGGALALAIALLGAFLGASLGALLTALRALPANCFGVCTGCAGEASKGPPLTEWLAAIFNELAGKPQDRGPLTLGDLWGPEDLADHERINLELMTTCLTQGRPLRLAHGHDELVKQFFYRPDELAQFFPQSVMDWLRARARPLGGTVLPAGMLPLPPMGDLPVVVAVRLSLSFPFLLSAVPLYAFDRSPYAPNTPRRCLFSDGGICSNFPIHFFDQPLPRWPTFGLNLRSFHPEQQPGADQSQNVWMPRDNNDGRQPEWQPIDHLGRLGQLPAFARLILHTGLGWRDNVYLRAAGYFDRVAHIFLTDEEGGLNLAMSAPQIAALAERGRAAAQLLLERYTSPPAPAIDLTWDNHRWVRYRTLMEFVQLLLGRLANGYRDTSHDERSYEDLVLRAASEKPESYPLTRRDRSGAVYGADALIELYYRWRVDDVDLGVRAPNPGPEVRITPRT